jgi:hypothetical protein
MRRFRSLASDEDRLLAASLLVSLLIRRGSPPGAIGD